MRRNLTPVKLRIILIALLLLLAGAGVGVFAYGYRQLDARATSAREAATKAEVSKSSLQNLAQTEKFFKENDTVVNHADQLVSESRSYLYQNQIINDINKYAQEAGIEIINISFDNPTKSKGSLSTPTVGRNTTESTSSGTLSQPVNIKTTVATVTVKSPTSYVSMLTFIHLIEQSLFRMQISNISLSQSNEQIGKGTITSDTLTIEAYIR